MKHIILVSILFAGLVSIANSVKSKQLFEVVNKELASTTNNHNKNAQSDMNSIFSVAEEENKSSSNEISFAQKTETKSLFGETDKKANKSIFGDSGDSDNSEANKNLNKNFENNNNSNFQKVQSLFDDAPTQSLLGDNTTTDNKNSNNNRPKKLFDLEEEPIKPQVKLNESIKPKISLPEKKQEPIVNKYQKKIQTNNQKKHLNIINHSDKKSERKPANHKNLIQKPIDDKTLQDSKSEIDKLKSKVVNLVTINKNLMKELDKKRKIKKKSLELSDDLINLIETHQSPIVEFEQNLKKTQTKSAEKLQRKESELKQTYGEVRKNLDVLVGKIDKTKTALKDVKSDENIMSGEIKKNFSTDSLSVLNNAQVEGSTTANIVNTESVDVGNIKFDLEKIMIVNPQTEIIVGSEILSVKELVENLDVLEKLKTRCGENLQDCVQYNEEHFESDIRRQNKIIDELKVLRKTTKDIIHRRD